MHILVIRFSAMGDVAMTVPVIKNALNQHPQLTITVVSNSFFAPIFDNIDRCQFFGADLKNKYAGVKGIYKLYKEIRKTYPNLSAVADFHNVLRSKLLRFFFAITGVSTAHINKGRKQKKQLTRKNNKIFKPLLPTVERYANVLRKLNNEIALKENGSFKNKEAIPELFEASNNSQFYKIGIAPFTAHPLKTYPTDSVFSLTQQLALMPNVQLFLLGAATDAPILNEWASSLPNTICVAGKTSFKQELSLISNLDVMLSMDSANMHLASMYGVSVISIWGPTHYYAGFYGWAQPVQNCIQNTKLTCRPCSVYGNKACWRKDWACMMQLSVDDTILELNQNS